MAVFVGFNNPIFRVILGFYFAILLFCGLYGDYMWHCLGYKTYYPLNREIGLIIHGWQKK